MTNSNNSFFLLQHVPDIGNKDTSAVYPKSLRVNRRNVLEALVWLKKHNPFYADVRINEANLDWMNNEEEVNIGTNATVLYAKYSKRYNVIAGKLEHVSVAHKSMRGLMIQKEMWKITNVIWK